MISAEDSPITPLATHPDFVVGNYFNKHRSRNPVVRWVMRHYNEVLEQCLDSDTASILEIGCGEGEILQRLKSKYPTTSLAGVDLESGIFEDIARQCPEIAFKVADARALPFPDKAFDQVLCCQVLEHADDPLRVIREAKRVARQSVLFSVPREPIWRVLNCLRGKYLSRWGNTPGHIQHWSQQSFYRFLEPEFARLTISLKAFPFIFVKAENLVGDVKPNA